MMKFLGELRFTDLKNTFSDIVTGYTPTNSTCDKSFRDFSKLENLDTPTPFENLETENVFIYPPSSNNATSESFLTVSDSATKLHYYKPEPTTDAIYDDQFTNRMNTYDESVGQSASESFSTVSDSATKLHYCKPEPITDVIYGDRFTDRRNTYNEPLGHNASESFLTTSNPTTKLHYCKTEPMTDGDQFANRINTYDEPVHMMQSYSQSLIDPMGVGESCMHSSATLRNHHHHHHQQQQDDHSLMQLDSNVIVSSNTVCGCSVGQSCISTVPTYNSNSLYQPNLPHKFYPRSSTTDQTNPTSMWNSHHIQQQQQQRQPSFVANIGVYLPTQKSVKPQTPKQHSSVDKPYACQFPNCIKRFARMDELKRHQRTHSDYRQFVCEVCHKGFTRSDHLMTHRRTHTGERPYECKHCDRRFARSDERNRHMRVHLRDRTRAPRKPRASKQFQPTDRPLAVVGLLWQQPNCSADFSTHQPDRITVI